MREILFRGQTRKKGEKVRLDGTPIDSNWVYGGIFPNNKGGDFAIIYQQYPKIEKYTVYAETIGQFTGLTDKNGKKIFEGDVIRVKYSLRLPAGFGNSIRTVTHNIDFIATVIFDKCRFCLEKAGGEVCEMPLDSEAVEVIGNIHDNPELLEVRE